MDDSSVGERRGLCQEHRKVLLCQMVQHMVGHDQVETEAFASQLGGRGLAEPHAGGQMPFRREATGARVRIDSRDLQAKPVARRPAGEHHRHIAAPAANIQEGGLHALAEAWPELGAIDAPPAGDGPVDQGKLGIGAVQPDRVTAGQVHLLDGVRRTFAQ